MPDRAFLYGNKPLTESDLEQAEQDALSGDSLQHQLAARLLLETRRLRHELADPLFMYASGRISRHALVCRDQDIARLYAEIQALKHAKQQSPA